MNEFISAGMDLKYYTHIEIDDWLGTPSKHAEKIEPSVYDNIYDAVKSAQRAGLKIAIHCEEGRGRTGTAIATLKLRELLEKAYIANPAMIEMEQIKSKRLDVIDFDENHRKKNCSVAVTPFVKEAVDYVRSFDNSNNTSVETLHDIETLLVYEQYLRTKFALREGHANIVKKFFECKDTNQDINLALEETVKSGRANVLRALIESKHPNLNVNMAIEYEGEFKTPLYIAAMKGYADVAKVLLNVFLDEDINEVLQDVIKKDDLNENLKVNVVEAFVEINHPALNINDALELAIKRFNIKVIKALLESNQTNPNLLNVNECFKRVLKKGNKDMIQVFLESKYHR